MKKSTFGDRLIDSDFTYMTVKLPRGSTWTSYSRDGPYLPVLRAGCRWD